MPPVGFELINSAGERQQTYALDGVASGTGSNLLESKIYTEGFSLIFLKYTANLGHPI
jgi:hypothetical protein